MLLFFAVGVASLMLIPLVSLRAAPPSSQALEQAKAELEAGRTTHALQTVEELIDLLPPPEILQEAYFL